MAMLHPNYVELMKVVNKDVEEGEEPVVSSRYSIVMAAAKRARQLVNGAEPLVDMDPKEKPLSVAVRELWEDKYQILDDEEDDLAEDKAPELTFEKKAEEALEAKEEAYEAASANDAAEDTADTSAEEAPKAE